MSQPLPSAFGPPVVQAAQMRASPEDFFVEEVASFEPSGEGEHLLLSVEKRGLTTHAVARRLAEWAGLEEFAIGYAGLKDRHAVTRQRFSVHLPRRIAPDLAALQSAELQVLQSSWHNRKLPRGALAGNRFILVLRQLQGDQAAIEQRLERIAARGLPNWFGEQRFGRGGDNVATALSMFAGRRVGREQRSILLSASRSELFNRVLAARVAEDSWDRGLEGEVWMLAGSRSVFGPEPWSGVLAGRLASFDIHPSAPLWGRGELRSSAACALLENSLLAADDALRLRTGLEDAGLKQERRATRLVAQGLAWQWQEPATLRLEFSLPPGSYATALLQELGEITDVTRPTSRSSESHAGHWNAGTTGV